MVPGFQQTRPIAKEEREVKPTSDFLPLSPQTIAHTFASPCLGAAMIDEGRVGSFLEKAV